MPKAKPTSSPTCIRLRGVRQNNLRNLDLDLPLGRLIVVTGLSGSGKSSLAFDTLYAEGQRRYVETFSPYARQFFDRMDKPAVDRIENIPPAIAIEQRNAVRTTRSTVGTMTEICDHLKVAWPHLARLHCRRCERVVRREPPSEVWRSTLAELGEGTEVLITFDLPLTDRLPFAEQVELIVKQGYQRALHESQVIRLAELPPAAASAGRLTVIQDRVRLTAASRSRFAEACEQAYHFGRGRLAVRAWTPEGPAAPLPFSAGFHCAPCDLDYREPGPALFSFNNPVGACPNCKGFGRIITIDPDLAVPDRTKTLAGGAVRPWQTGMSAGCQADLVKIARKRRIPMDVPFQDLSEEHRRMVMEGDPEHDPNDPKRCWPHHWYGVRGFFRWLESKAYKMHVRVLLSRYRSYRPCPDCQGRRFNAESLQFRLHPPALPGEAGAPAPLTLADLHQLPVRDALALVDRLLAALKPKRTDPLGIVLGEVRTRLGFLDEVGLGYLTLDRPTRTLSGGETERVNLTTCLGTRLVNTLFVLDEPSVGLHPRDTARLIAVLQRLRDAGNTVVVVEHESSVMRAADQLVDLGPGHGETGGRVVFQGAPGELRKAEGSLTADYLTGRRRIPTPPRRPAAGADAPRLRLEHVTAHNLRDVSVDIPLGRLVVVSGVSGSGKTTLIREVLLPLLQERLQPTGVCPADDSGEGGESESGEAEAGASRPRAARLSGWEELGAVSLVDQSSLGRTPRSNPGVYIGAFEDIRDFFAGTAEARERGLGASAFSFNSAQGQCEHCRGAGFEKIEMQFLSDVFIRCAACGGRRYREHILDVTVSDGTRAWSVADLLEAPVETAADFLARFPDSAPARRAVAKLRLLDEVGLGYLRVGQPINTLSGGESQRLKLVSHLVETSALPHQAGGTPYLAAKPTLFLFDEPTTGLHFDDVRVLLAVFQRLVDAGNTVVVIEHNLDVIRSADWLIDLGPGAGDEGGRVIATGTPEAVAAAAVGPTGEFLRAALAEG